MYIASFIIALCIGKEKQNCKYILISLTLCVPMKFPIKVDRIKPGWSILYIEGSQVIISKTYYISFSEDRFCQSKQCRPR